MQIIKKCFKSLPLRLIITILIGYIIGDLLSQNQARLFYTASVSIKDYLTFLLPFIIFFYLSGSLMSFKSNAPALLFILVGMVVLSNSSSVMISYFASWIFIKNTSTETLISSTSKMNIEELTPFWDLSFLSWASADRALIAGLVIGIIVAYTQNKRIIKFLETGKNIVEILLKKTFVPLLPLYILGFVIKLDREDALTFLINNYANVFLITCLLLISYISIIYLIGSYLQKKSFIDSIKNMIPAGITGFSTLSSAAAMPVTLKATEKNLGDKDSAGFIIPATANIHMMADSIAIPLIVIFIMKMFGQSFPEFSQYLVFTLFYCIAKFSSAAVPGGGVIVLIPVFEKHLGLSPEAASLVATIYILHDPIFTCGNVMGNGAFAMILKKIMSPFLKKNSV